MHVNVFFKFSDLDHRRAFQMRNWDLPPDNTEINELANLESIFSLCHRMHLSNRETNRYVLRVHGVFYTHIEVLCEYMLSALGSLWRPNVCRLPRGSDVSPTQHPQTPFGAQSHCFETNTITRLQKSKLSWSRHILSRNPLPYEYHIKAVIWDKLWDWLPDYVLKGQLAAEIIATNIMLFHDLVLN